MNNVLPAPVTDPEAGDRDAGPATEGAWSGFSSEPAPEESGWRPILLEFALGIQVSVPTVLLAFALAAIYNHGIDELVDRGHEVREPLNLEVSEATDSMVAVGLTMSAVSLFVFALEMNLVRVGMCGRWLDRRTWMCLLQGCGAFVLLQALYVGLHAADVDVGEQPKRALGTAVLLAAVWVSADRLASGIPGLDEERRRRVCTLQRRRAIAQLFFVYAHISLVLPLFFEDAIPDAARVAYVAALPFAVDVATYQARAMAHIAPAGGASSASLSLIEASGLAMQHLLSRVMIVGMRTSGGVAAAAVASAAGETASRLTLRARDAFYSRGAAAGSENVALVAAAHHLLDQALEVAMTIAVICAHVAFRLGAERAAPSTADLFVSLALQLGVEAAVDAAPFGVATAAVLLGGGGSRMRAWGRSKLSAAADMVTFSAHSRNRLFRATLSLLVLCLSFWLLANLFSPDRARAYCPWSRSGGWWHRAPCSLTKEWLR